MRWAENAGMLTMMTRRQIFSLVQQPDQSGHTIHCGDSPSIAAVQLRCRKGEAQQAERGGRGARRERNAVMHARDPSRRNLAVNIRCHEFRAGALCSSSLLVYVDSWEATPLLQAPVFVSVFSSCRTGWRGLATARGERKQKRECTGGRGESLCCPRSLTVNVFVQAPAVLCSPSCCLDRLPCRMPSLRQQRVQCPAHETRALNLVCAVFFFSLPPSLPMASAQQSARLP